MKGSETRLVKASVLGAKREIGAGEIAALSRSGRKPSTSASTPLPFWAKELTLIRSGRGLLECVFYEQEATSSTKSFTGIYFKI